MAAAGAVVPPAQAVEGLRGAGSRATCQCPGRRLVGSAFDQEHRGRFHPGRGSSLERVTDDVVEVVSGGEDGLESLEYSINATLGEAVLAADSDACLSVLAERRVKDA